MANTPEVDAVFMDLVEEPSKKQERLTSNCFAETRQCMLSGRAAMTKQPIGELYCVGEKVTLTCH